MKQPVHPLNEWHRRVLSHSALYLAVLPRTERLSEPLPATSGMAERVAQEKISLGDAA